MMKNTEWGAVAYLSHSKYGINSKININNFTNNDTDWYIKTGYSANPNTEQENYAGEYGTNNNSLWNTPNGYLASTTGNISGVYDMSGGSQEYMASFRIGASGITNTDAKYYDVYGASTSQTDYKFRILGDATGEMGPFKSYGDEDGTNRTHNWYNNISYFVHSDDEWFGRGGDSSRGIIAGAFYFSCHTGRYSLRNGTRIVLSPTA